MRTETSKTIESTVIWHDSRKEMPKKSDILIGLYGMENKLIPFPVRFLDSGAWEYLDGSPAGRPVFWVEYSVPSEIRLQSPYN